MSKFIEEINVRVEYESTPIRHLAIQCPHCKNWFHASDLCDEWIHYSYQIETTEFLCPICQKYFNEQKYTREIYGIGYVQAKFNYTETSGAEETYKDCKKKVETWE